MGRLEDRFEEVKQTQLALRGKLLEEAAHLQAAERAVAEATEARHLAEARARRSEIGYVAVMLGSFLAACAWAFSAQYARRQKCAFGMDAVGFGDGGASETGHVRESPRESEAPSDAKAAAGAAVVAAALGAAVADAHVSDPEEERPPMRVTAPRVGTPDRHTEYFDLADDCSDNDDGGSGAAPRGRRGSRATAGAQADGPECISSSPVVDFPGEENQEEGDPI